MAHIWHIIAHIILVVEKFRYICNPAGTIRKLRLLVVSKWRRNGQAAPLQYSADSEDLKKPWKWWLAWIHTLTSKQRHSPNLQIEIWYGLLFCIDTQILVALPPTSFDWSIPLASQSHWQPFESRTFFELISYHSRVSNFQCLRSTIETPPERISILIGVSRSFFLPIPFF